jgi:chromosome segregation ATPase
MTDLRPSAQAAQSAIAPPTPANAGFKGTRVIALQSCALALLLSLLGACATGPRPQVEADAAQIAISKAEASNAEEDAPVELRFAREQLREAQAWLSKEKNESARDAFERARVHAELADIKARALQTAQALGRVQREHDALKTQLDAAREGLGGEAKRGSKRNSGNSP